MSDKDLDSLFNKKLEGFESTPGQEAWEKIVTNIHPKGINWKFYLTIAASLLLVGVVTIMMFSSSENTDSATKTEVIALDEKAEQPKKIEVPVEDKVIASSQTEEPDNVANEGQKDKAAVVQTAKQEAQTKKEIVSQKNVIAQVIEEDKKDESVRKLLIANMEPVTRLSGTTASVEETPIVFTGEKVVLTEPDENGESPRGINLKKVMNMARDFKTDNQSWSTLREAKNELLSLGRKKNESSDD